jgi:flagellar motor protein MotB
MMNHPKAKLLTGWKEVDPKGSRVFTLTGDTTFYLVARSDKRRKIKRRTVKVLPSRKYVTNVDTTQSFGRRPMHCDIISVDQSDFPRQITMRVVVVDTVGNFVHSLAPPYVSKKKARKYFKPIVEEANGKKVYHDFSIREIRRDTSKSYNISMVLDHSGSMTGIIDSVIKGAKEFIRNKYREDQVSVTKFNHLIYNTREAMKDKEKIIDSAHLKSDPKVGGSTALYAATDQGIINLKKNNPNKVVVLFTDGKENASFIYFGSRAFTAKQVAKKVHGNDIQLFILSYGSAVNKKSLNKLAQLSGGEHYNIQRDFNITNVFKELPRVFKYYYEISFNPLNDTGKHKLTLKFNNLKGTIVENERTFFIGKNYGFKHEFNLPTYLLTEIPVRAEILSPPQAVARFKFDKHSLEMQYFEVLNKYIEFLTKNPEAEILLAGHTDSKGTAQYCKELSDDRAEEVKEYIIKSGIAAYRIHTRGYGRRHLKWDPDNKDFKARENRRVEAVLYED